MEKNTANGKFFVNTQGFSYFSPTGQPSGEQTSSNGLAQLKVLNSFSNEKELFVPRNPDQINWYMCGPTVYDDSHLGHARTYICSDILRRLMTDYFGYNIHLCMNITDIDDKIINRANERKIKFDDLSRNFETEFLNDCEALNIRLPNVITRVSEYVPEIVDFIAKIIENGYAYEAQGSVYFNTTKFHDDPCHHYPKLEPKNYGNEELLAEGEGALSVDLAVGQKNKKDFALWKKSKANEPFWESPWGQGRPGWHIECSAMAGAIFPEEELPVDIHSGGVDLKFPHHDNEIAQSEAYYGCDSWINHFWHTGHLHIDGLKMSKSKKNFTTIKNVLETYTAKQIRMLFLLHQWNTTMNYLEENSFPEAIAKERQLDNFFKVVKSTLRTVDIRNTVQKWNDEDKSLNQALSLAKSQVREALCDNFDTATAIDHLSKLVVKTNKYLANDPKLVKIPIVRQVSNYVFHILKCFGLYDEGDFPAAGGTQGSYEETIAPVMNALVTYRDQVKNNAKDGHQAMFKISDELRDDVLPYLGVKIEDKGQGNSSTWYSEDKAVLIKERETKLAAKEAAAQKKAAVAAEALKKKSTSGKDWFKVFESDKYTAFDPETGLPTHQVNPKAKEGEEKTRPLNPQEIKKLAMNQKKIEDKYQKWVSEQEEKKE